MGAGPASQACTPPRPRGPAAEPGRGRAAVWLAGAARAGRAGAAGGAGRRHVEAAKKGPKVKKIHTRSILEQKRMLPAETK